MSHNCPFDLIVITGPTATGKTRLAALLADKYYGEIISADSRQVYKNMDIGTGKDLNDYIINNKKIPYHLIDIRNPGYEYNVYEYQNDFLKAFNLVKSNNKQAILCGGTGFYIESVLSGKRIIEVPVNKELRKELEEYSFEKLVNILASMKKLHNKTDITERKRLIRAIEIEKHKNDNEENIKNYPKFNYIIFAINFERRIIRERITYRLKKRLEEGMINEVENLMKAGLSPEKLKYYGLEYKYITEYITSEIDYDSMFKNLNTGIHQFAKRQMTWFRRMEKNGYKIHWIDGKQSDNDKIAKIDSFF